MAEDERSDPEMAALARDEIEALKPKIEALKNKLRILLLPKDAADDRSIILEVRAGTGGDEAALFAADLFRMYQRYADLHGWKTEIISISENDLGGIKEVIASISGHGVFARLKFRSACIGSARSRDERVGDSYVRATVAVLPGQRSTSDQAGGYPYRYDEGERCGRPAREQNGLGGRITHLPTGIVFISAEVSTRTGG